MGVTGSHSFGSTLKVALFQLHHVTLKLISSLVSRRIHLQKTHRRIPVPPAVHTWVVPAASGSAASPPLPLIQAGVPLLQLVVLQGVSRQVAELQAAELTQEVAEGHPETPNRADAPLDQVLVLFF